MDLGGLYISNSGEIIDRKTGEIISPEKLLKANLDILIKQIKDLQKDSIEITGKKLDVSIKRGKYKNVSREVAKLDFKHFNISDKDNMKKLLNEDISIYSLAFITKFQGYIEFPTNVIVIDGTPPSTTEMAKLMCVSQRKMMQILKELESKEIIKRVRIGWNIAILFNPFIYSAGTVVDIETYNYFVGSRWNEDFSKEKIQPK